MKSLPAWECGLKSSGIESNRLRPDVTPCVGVWIEIGQSYYLIPFWKCHSLRGSVD